MCFFVSKSVYMWDYLNVCIFVAVLWTVCPSFKIIVSTMTEKEALRIHIILAAKDPDPVFLKWLDLSDPDPFVFSCLSNFNLILKVNKKKKITKHF